MVVLQCVRASMQPLLLSDNRATTCVRVFVRVCAPVSHSSFGTYRITCVWSPSARKVGVAMRHEKHGEEGIEMKCEMSRIVMRSQGEAKQGYKKERKGINKYRETTPSLPPFSLHPSILCLHSKRNVRPQMLITSPVCIALVPSNGLPFTRVPFTTARLVKWHCYWVARKRRHQQNREPN